MHPLSFIDADVRGALLSSSAGALTADDQAVWTQVLGEVDAARLADGSSRYYYGVVNPDYSSGIAGIGYVGGKSAMGWDKLPSAAAVAAHEWGHNWGRQHSPCGNASSPDPSYPHSDGSTGAYGLDVATVTLKPPTYKDLMAYCDPEWISDYTYTGVLNYRQANPDISTALTQAMQPCLLVWGRIENGQPVLEPAFEVVTRPSLPARGGDYSLEGRAADGSRVFSLAFTPAEIADVDAPTRQFAFAIPISSAHAAQLATLRLAGRGREAISASSGTVPRPARALRPSRSAAPPMAGSPCGGIRRRAPHAAGPRWEHRADHLVRPRRQCPAPGGSVAVVGFVFQSGAERRGESGGARPMRATFLTMLAVGALAGCHHTTPVAEPKPESILSPVITLERTACMGRCPVYTLAIERTGAVRFDGKQFVQHAGPHNANIPPMAVDSLVAELTAGGFFAFRRPVFLRCPSLRTVRHRSAERDRLGHRQYSHQAGRA